MNDDDSTFEIPDYILSRLQPTLTLGFPARQDELAILQYHLPFADDRDAEPDGRVPAAGARAEARLLDARRDQRAAVRDEADRVRIRSTRLAKDEAWRASLKACLGDDALDLQSLSNAEEVSRWAATPCRWGWAISSSIPRTLCIRTTKGGMKSWRMISGTTRTCKGSAKSSHDLRLWNSWSSDAYL